MVCIVLLKLSDFEVPAIHSFSPTRWAVTGGISVTIYGIGLGNGSDITGVKISNVTITSLLQQNSSELIVIAGAASTPTAGPVITESSSVGVLTSAQQFIYMSSS